MPVNNVTVGDLQRSPELFHEFAAALDDGGLVCIPCGGAYRLLADLGNEGAVLGLLQSKRRTMNKPSLVFIDCAERLSAVAAEIDPVTQRLTERFWPGHLTCLVEPHPDLPAKVRGLVARANKRIGVRVPDDPIVLGLLRAFGRPVLASSANRERKPGADSRVQVRKNFGTIRWFVDGGDLKPGPRSTVVSVEGGEARVSRPGDVSWEEIEAALA